MAGIDELFTAALKTLGPKPPDNAPQAAKKAYSEKLSNVIAPAFAAELRLRGLNGVRPDEPGGAAGTSGAERRMSGAIGAKKVDVTWATEESGLLLGISIKSINFRDSRTGNFQKNLTNRRGDMLYEAVTLHRRFPYSVLGGFFFLDKDAATDQTARRRSTFQNAHTRFGLFDGRNDPAGRDEQYERLWIVLLDANPFTPTWQCHRVGEPDTPVTLDDAFTDLLNVVATRNPDFYELDDNGLRKAT